MTLEQIEKRLDEIVKMQMRINDKISILVDQYEALVQESYALDKKRHELEGFKCI